MSPESPSPSNLLATALSSASRFRLAFLQSTTFKVGVILFLILILQIPRWKVEDLVRERSQRSLSVKQEVSESWGPGQTLGAPLLCIPYDVEVRDSTGKVSRKPGGRWFIAPNRLSIRGKLMPTSRRRGLFEVPLYRTELVFEGEFRNADWKRLRIDPSLWRPAEALVGFPLMERRGLADSVMLEWEDTSVALNADGGEHFPSGEFLSAPIASLEAGRLSEGIPFRMVLALQGSDHLSFAPWAGMTEVNLHSTWPSPGFFGAFLPAKHDISSRGFTADWKVSGLAGGRPRAWDGNPQPGSLHSGSLRSGSSEGGKAFGVRMALPVDHYAQTSRAVKYAALFILLTFAVFLLFELLLGARLHPMNYLLVGCSLVLFYMVLLALSEYLVFSAAYALAAAATVGLVGGYSLALIPRRLPSLLLMGLLLFLYGYLFILLRLEDYSLLLGSLALFLMLGTFMFLTRKLDWSHPQGRA